MTNLEFKKGDLVKIVDIHPVSAHYNSIYRIKDFVWRVREICKSAHPSIVKGENSKDWYEISMYPVDESEPFVFCLGVKLRRLTEEEEDYILPYLI